RAIEQFKFREALQLVMDLARAGNKYLADTEPWHLIKTDPSRVATILYTALQLTANLTILLEPFLPFTSRRLGQWLGYAMPRLWEQAGSMDLLAPGTTIQKPTLLFEKIADESVTAQQAKLQHVVNT
ncbi:MAG: class I tRNA ligase family protein, partial [Bacteroidota bacterium]